MKTICCAPNIQALAWKRIQQDLSSFNSLIPTALMVSMLNLVLFCHLIQWKCKVHLAACCYKQILVGKASAEAHSNNALLQPIWMKEVLWMLTHTQACNTAGNKLILLEPENTPSISIQTDLDNHFSCNYISRKKTESKEGLTNPPAFIIWSHNHLDSKRSSVSVQIRIWDMA